MYVLMILLGVTAGICQDGGGDIVDVVEVLSCCFIILLGPAQLLPGPDSSACVFLLGACLSGSVISVPQ